MIVVGAGRVGTALATRAREHGLGCALVDRGSGWEAFDSVPGEPVVLAVRNDDLDEVLARVPESHRKNLVFVQNGMIRPWLHARGLDGTTRGLLFFAVQKRGDPITPGGTSPFTGPLAVVMAQAFRQMGLDAGAVSDREFAAVELEKLEWNCIFGLLCEARGASVGAIVREHRAEVGALTEELTRVGNEALGLELEPAPLAERLCAYSTTIPDYRGAVKEWPWRNGWFVDEARRRRIATPLHEELLREIGKM